LVVAVNDGPQVQTREHVFLPKRLAFLIWLYILIS
jgi:translation elongation factor EF-Tu-like GTPase